MRGLCIGGPHDAEEHDWPETPHRIERLRDRPVTMYGDGMPGKAIEIQTDVYHLAVIAGPDIAFWLFQGIDGTAAMRRLVKAYAQEGSMRRARLASWSPSTEAEILADTRRGFEAMMGPTLSLSSRPLGVTEAEWQEHVDRSRVRCSTVLEEAMRKADAGEAPPDHVSLFRAERAAMFQDDGADLQKPTGHGARCKCAKCAADRAEARAKAVEREYKRKRS